MPESEKEKMHRGALYDAINDPNLVAERRACKDLCHEFNLLPPSDAEGQRRIIQRLFGKAADNACVVAPFFCDYGYNITVGRGFFANHNCVILDCAAVAFGDNVLVGPNCCFSTAGHPLDAARRIAGLEYALPITVGNDVWFGMGVMVLPGVTIGDGAVVGAGSVVTKNIPAGVVAVGNPCRVVRRITEDDGRRYC